MIGGFFFIAWAFVLTILVPFLYQFGLEVTRVSPLSPLNRDALIQTTLATMQLVLFSAVTLALLVALAGFFLSFVRRQKPFPRWLVAAVALCLLALGLLPAVENFFYIVVGSSLKTSDSLAQKLVIGTIVLILAGAFVRPLLWLAEELSHSRVLGALLLIGYAAAFATTAVAVERRITSSNLPANQALYNVLILSSDGVDADRMSIYGHDLETTPFLEKISSELLIFRNAFTNNGNTTGSITALFTGRSPLKTHVVYPPDILVGEDAVMHLPGILGSYGYYRSNWGVPHFADASSQNLIGAFDSNVGIETGHDLTSVLPVDDEGTGGWFVRRTVADIQSLALDILNIEEAPNPFDQITGGKNTLTDEQRLEGVLADISREQPFFTHVHFMDTHGPRFSPKDPMFSAGLKQTENYQPEFLADAIRDFDARVERAYNALRQSGKLENTIFIVTSDHGKLYSPTLRIPLLIRLPNKLRTGVVHQNVQRIDIAPTILSLLQIPTPAWMDGQNLLEPVPADRMIFVTNTLSGKLGSNGQWVHSGSSTFDAHLITAIYCDRSFSFVPSRKEAQSQRVGGSTSPCTVEDTPSRLDAVTRVLKELTEPRT